MKTLIRYILWPLDALDRLGEPDHGKLVGWVVTFLFGWKLVTVPEWPSPWTTLFFLAAMFGPRMFYKAIQNKLPEPSLVDDER